MTLEVPRYNFAPDPANCLGSPASNAAKEARSFNMNIRDGLKKRIGAAFLSTTEVSSQECMY